MKTIVGMKVVDIGEPIEVIQGWGIMRREDGGLCLFRMMGEAKADAILLGLNTKDLSEAVELAELMAELVEDYGINVGEGTALQILQAHHENRRSFQGERS